MDSTKYIGMDVHKEATTRAVMNSAGKLVMESIVENEGGHDCAVPRRTAWRVVSCSVPCGGTSVYAPRHRAEWLSKVTEGGVRRRAELFYPATGCIAKVAPGSATRSIGGEPQAWRDGPAPADSSYRSDSGCSADRTAADTAPV